MAQRKRVWAVPGKALPLVDADGATVHSTPVRFVGRHKPVYEQDGMHRPFGAKEEVPRFVPVGDEHGEINPEGEEVPWPGPGYYYLHAVQRDHDLTDVDPRGTAAKAGE